MPKWELPAILVLAAVLFFAPMIWVATHPRPGIQQRGDPPNWANPVAFMIIPSLVLGSLLLWIQGLSERQRRSRDEQRLWMEATRC